MVRVGRRSVLPSAAALALTLGLGCARREAAPVAIRNPDFLVVRTIVREADAEHTIRVDLPYAGAGYGFASTAPLLDLRQVDAARATFAGGRTSLVGEAAIWLPLTPEGARRLQSWSERHTGERLGLFLDGRLAAAPQIQSAIGGGIPLRVASKGEGDAVLARLRNGGAPP
jgi:preprotein translocase subunit SecD